MNNFEKEYELEVNEIFTIELSSNPSTGFCWVWVEENNNPLIEKLNNTFTASDKNLAGSSGIEVWEFKTLKKGTIILNFEYKRVWEKKPPLEHKKLKINII